MSSLSKLAVQIALEAAGDSKPDFLVFCSQHGDLTRLREMLRDIASGVELSPTAFSQSVHNASAGLYHDRCAQPRARELPRSGRQHVRVGLARGGGLSRSSTPKLAFCS